MTYGAAQYRRTGSSGFSTGRQHLWDCPWAGVTRVRSTELPAVPTQRTLSDTTDPGSKCPSTNSGAGDARTTAGRSGVSAAVCGRCHLDPLRRRCRSGRRSAPTCSTPAATPAGLPTCNRQSGTLSGSGTQCLGNLQGVPESVKSGGTFAGVESDARSGRDGRDDRELGTNGHHLLRHRDRAVRRHRKSQQLTAGCGQQGLAGPVPTYRDLYPVPPHGLDVLRPVDQAGAGLRHGQSAETTRSVTSSRRRYR